MSRRSRTLTKKQLLKLGTIAAIGSGAETIRRINKSKKLAQIKDEEDEEDEEDETKKKKLHYSVYATELQHYNNSKYFGKRRKSRRKSRSFGLRAIDNIIRTDPESDQKKLITTSALLLLTKYFVIDGGSGSIMPTLKGMELSVITGLKMTVLFGVLVKIINSVIAYQKGEKVDNLNEKDKYNEDHLISYHILSSILGI